MNDNLKTIHDVDVAFLATEKARLGIEAAKVALELAKQDAEAARLRLEDSLTKAEEAGFPRAKLRKLAEERATALLSSGLLKNDGVSFEKPIPKTAKTPRRAKSAELAQDAVPADAVDAHGPADKFKSESDWSDDDAPAETLRDATI